MSLSVSVFGIAAFRQAARARYATPCAPPTGPSSAGPSPATTPRRGRHRRGLAVLAGGLAAAAFALGAAAPARSAESRFDTGDDGWTLVDAKTGVGNAPVVWLPEGRINTNDVYDWNAFAAPAAFTGDLRGYVGGSLSFDLQATRQDVAAASYFGAALRSGPDLLVWFGGAPSLTELTHFSVAFDAGGGWELNPTALGAPGTGVTVDAAAFSAFVAQVDGLYIDADWRGGSDNVTLDNVVLAAVPEPVTWALMLVGLVAVGRAARPGRLGTGPAQPGF